MRRAALVSVSRFAINNVGITCGVRPSSALFDNIRLIALSSGCPRSSQHLLTYTMLVRPFAGSGIPAVITISEPG
jgi:hypothetical protein